MFPGWGPDRGGSLVTEGLLAGLPGGIPGDPPAYDDAGTGAVADRVGGQ